MSVEIAPPSSEYDVEFRSIVDDAWYSVRTVLDGEKLTIKYQNFSDEEDTVFEAKSFESLEEVERFEESFRPLSTQLQDNECHKVTKGVSVCVSHSSNGFDNRFYDAIIDDVFFKEHAFGNGVEDCLCTFLVIMEHGPIAGDLLEKKIENLCLVQSSACLDPNLLLFLDMTREKLQGEPCLLENSKLIPSLDLRLNKCVKRSPCNKPPHKVVKRKYHGELTGEDGDLGGDRNCYMLLVDNLDKDLSPSTIVEFIHRHTSLSVQACVFPSILSETYTKGALLLHDGRSLETLSKFLDCPNHIITSKRGRPWVVTGNLSGHVASALSIQNFMHKYQKTLQNTSIGNALKVVCSGTEEYETAKRLRDLFVQFTEHQQRLHKSLAMEERKILQPPLV